MRVGDAGGSVRPGGVAGVGLQLSSRCESCSGRTEMCSILTDLQRDVGLSHHDQMPTDFNSLSS